MVGLIRRCIFGLGQTVLVGGSLLLSACSTPPLQRICEDEFPLFDRRLDDALALFVPAIDPGDIPKAGKDRALASTATIRKPIALSERDQDQWVSWSESQLWGIQGALLAVPELITPERRIGAKKSLNQVANLLVMFHGQASRRDSESMLRLLERMKEPQSAARAGLCQAAPR